MDKVIDRFFNLISYETMSKYDTEKKPSTESQLTFIRDVLYSECIAIGLSDVTIDEYGYLFATLPSNIEEEVPVIGFMAHVDTSPDFSGQNVSTKIWKDYKGNDLKLNATTTLSPKEFPLLKNYIGQDIITTDGNTLLGADDKAGVAEILTAMQYLINNPSILHGKIRIAFTTDEEIGAGVDNFNVEKFGAKFAYTIDGGEIGQLEFQSFNAARARITIEGKNVHPGYAKDIMVNAALVATELCARFPKNETPATTEKLEGYYHLTNFTGDVSKATLEYIIRDFDKDRFENRKDYIVSLVDELNSKFQRNIASFTLKDEYYNMYEILEKPENIILRDLAIAAMKEASIEPKITEIRGGTDGSRLSFMGLPCPNIFTGGHNFHGPYEFIPAQSMVKAVEVIVNICKLLPKQI